MAYNLQYAKLLIQIEHYIIIEPDFSIPPSFHCVPRNMLRKHFGVGVGDAKIRQTSKTMLVGSVDRAMFFQTENCMGQLPSQSASHCKRPTSPVPYTELVPGCSTLPRLLWPMCRSFDAVKFRCTISLIRSLMIPPIPFRILGFPIVYVVSFVKDIGLFARDLQGWDHLGVSQQCQEYNWDGRTSVLPKPRPSAQRQMVWRIVWKTNESVPEGWLLWGARPESQNLVSLGATSALESTRVF